MGQPVRNELKVPNPFLCFQFVLHAMIEYLTFSFYDFISYDFFCGTLIQKNLDGFTSLTVGRNRALSLSAPKIGDLLVFLGRMFM